MLCSPLVIVVWPIALALIMHMTGAFEIWASRSGRWAAACAGSPYWPILFMLTLFANIAGALLIFVWPMYRIAIAVC